MELERKKILILAANPKTTPRLRLDEETRGGVYECFFVAFSWFYSLYSPNLIIETKAGNVPG